MVKLISVSRLLITLTIALVVLDEVHSHGMMLDPVSRSSRWRTDRTAPTNYDDNGLYCGGFGVQWGTNGGKCGLCGDAYNLPTPRPNEIGGRYGQGVIVKEYSNTFMAYLGIQVTANHLGFFYFNLCNLDEFGGESEACFNKYLLSLVDGSRKLYIGSATGWVNATVVLPKGLSCSHCVLRWSYQGGNNWGYCDDGSGATGCGPQENFKNCADIKITAATNRFISQDIEVIQPPSYPETADDSPVDPNGV